MTRPNLVAIQSRLSAASPGPWEAADEHELVAPCNPAWYVCQVRPGWEAMPEEEGYVEDVACMVQRDHEQAKANAQFMAHAREDVPALLDEVERLKSEMHMRELHHFEEEQKRIEAEVEAERLRIQLAAVIRFAQPGTHSLEDVAKEFGVDLDDQEGKS